MACDVLPVAIFFLDFLKIFICVDQTAWAPEGHEGRSQAGLQGRQLEVGAQRSPRLPVHHKIFHVVRILPETPE